MWRSNQIQQKIRRKESTYFSLQKIYIFEHYFLIFWKRPTKNTHEKDRHISTISSLMKTDDDADKTAQDVLVILANR